MKLNKRPGIFCITLLFGFLLVLSTGSGSAQDISVSRQYPKDFRYPMDLPPVLAGCFGEIRGNHFHSGLDFKTNQREGYPVYAVADGFISRLRVQIGGFGNAVYIAHPNGYTSVYAHLQKFNDRIAQSINDYQYQTQRFDVDFSLLPVEIPVKKGDIIAWSGNTGSTAGPHLHFEIRDSQTEETINPQLFGFYVPDKVKPRITALYMYRLGERPFSPATVRQYFQVVGSNGNYHLNQSPVININGNTGFGLHTFDEQIAGSNKNGVYSTELQLDGHTIFCSVLERFSFANSRAVNAYIDYPSWISRRITIQKSFIEPGNPLKIYREAMNRGIVKLDDDSIHQMKYILKDANGNTSTLSFRVRNNPASVISPEPEEGGQPFSYNRENTFSAPGLKVQIPRGSLYNDILFRYSASSSRGYSPVHQIHSPLTPLHAGYALWIKPDSTLPVHLRQKALIMGTTGGSQGGSFDESDGFVKANPRTFGNFYVAVDTLPPSISALNVSDGKSMKAVSSILFRISDNLSGIKSFTGTIDGKWVLMEYNFKTRRLWHTFDYRTAPGKHLFELTVSDMKDNTRTYSATFYK